MSPKQLSKKQILTTLTLVVARGGMWEVGEMSEGGQ